MILCRLNDYNNLKKKKKPDSHGTVDRNYAFPINNIN